MLTGFTPTPQAAALIQPVPESSTLTVNVAFRNTRDVCYCEKNHRLTDEKYIFTVSDDGTRADVICSGEKSAFYALRDISCRLADNTLQSGTFTGAPSFAVRGYIEGFYGTPWSHGERTSVLALMAENRMNTVYYAPKDDDYHRALWRSLYPDDALAKLKELADEAAAYYMDFYWCIAPGLSMHYADDREFEALMQKTKQLYGIGIRRFGLLLDDISEHLIFPEDVAMYGETVNAHIALIERYYNALTDMDPAIRLTVCPTQYHGRGNEYFIAKLGQNISPKISVFWTGRDICSRELTSREAVDFIEGTRHKPLYWDNYPVNDCAMFNEMHLGPVINRDPDLHKYAEGIIANCMEYAECSKIPLITIADYLWDSEHYDPEAAWQKAIGRIIGSQNVAAFLPFADHLRTSCLMDDNSPRMVQAFIRMEAAMNAGDKDTLFAVMEELSREMDKARELLRQDLPLFREMARWIQKFGIACDILHKVLALKDGRDDAVLEEIDILSVLYENDPTRLTEDININAEVCRLLAALA